jgi:protein TonB
VDPNVARELHQRLQSNAARCYPSASRRFHEQGITEVSFCVGDSGQLAEAKLAHSSGSERLDRAALDCVIGDSEPFPAAHGRCFALPVKFGD